MAVSYRRRLLWSIFLLSIVIVVITNTSWTNEIARRTVAITGNIGNRLKSTIPHTRITTCFTIHSNNASSMTENHEEYQVNYSNCYLSFIKQTDRLLNLPMITSAFFRSLGNAVIDKWHTSLGNYTTRRNDIIYIGQEHFANFIKYLPSINTSFILISHWNDLNISVKAYRVIIENPHLIVWFSTNVVDEHEKLRIIPQGLWPEGLYGRRNDRMMYDMALNLTHFNERKILLFNTFSRTVVRWPGRLHLNRQLCSQFANRSDIVCSSKDMKWQDYMQAMGNSKFVISPTGRGLDCFRTWEALLVGAVPIVLNSSINQLYDDMPIMIINDYQKLTVERLYDFERTLKFRNGIITPRLNYLLGIGYRKLENICN